MANYLIKETCGVAGEFRRLPALIENPEMLGWVDLETQRKAHKCILVFKCLNNLAPPYLSDYFIRNCNVHSYNTRKRNDMHLPKPKLTLGKRTFRYSGALHFNNLPTTIKEATSLPIFKNLLRLYFRE